MKKILCLLSITLVIAASALALQVSILKVKTRTANVYAEPDAKSAVLKRLYEGTLIEAKQKIDHWFEVMIAGEDGQTLSGFINELVVDEITSREKTIQPAEPSPLQAPAEQSQDWPRSAPPRRYRGGVRIFGGLASASVSHPPSDIPDFRLEDYEKPKAGFGGGIGFETSGRLAIEVDLMYVQKGVNIEGTVDYAGYTADFSFKNSTDEISVPVLLRFKFLPGPTPYIVAGGEIAYVMKNKGDLSYTLQPLDLSNNDSKDFIENTSRIDYGLVLGAGFEAQLTGITLFLDLRYHLGLANLAKANQDYAVPVEEGDWVHTRTLLILAGMKF